MNQKLYVIKCKQYEDYTGLCNVRNVRTVCVQCPMAYYVERFYQVKKQERTQEENKVAEEKESV